jgi:hypothetical protein
MGDYYVDIVYCIDVILFPRIMQFVEVISSHYSRIMTGLEGWEVMPNPETILRRTTLYKSPTPPNP